MNRMERLQAGDVSAFEEEYQELLDCHNRTKVWGNSSRIWGDSIAQQTQKVLEIAKLLNLKEVVFKWNVALFNNGGT